MGNTGAVSASRVGQKRAGNCDSGGRIRRIEDACFPPLQRSVAGGHARMLNPIHPARPWSQKDGTIDRLKVSSRFLKGEDCQLSSADRYIREGEISRGGEILFRGVCVFHNTFLGRICFKFKVIVKHLSILKIYLSGIKKFD